MLCILLLYAYVAVVCAQNCNLYDQPYADLNNLTPGEDGIPARTDYRANFQYWGRKFSCETEYDVTTEISASYENKVVSTKTYTELHVKSHDFQDIIPYAASRIYCTKSRQCTTLATSAFQCITPGTRSNVTETESTNVQRSEVIKNTNCSRIDGVKILLSNRHAGRTPNTYWVDNLYENTVDFSFSGFHNVHVSSKNRVLEYEPVLCAGTIFMPSTEESPHNIMTRYCTMDAIGNKVVASSAAALFYQTINRFNNSCPTVGEPYKIQDFARTDDNHIVCVIHTILNGSVVRTVKMSSTFTALDMKNVVYALVRALVANDTTATIIDEIRGYTSIVFDGKDISVEYMPSGNPFGHMYTSTYSLLTEDFEFDYYTKANPRFYITPNISSGLCSIVNLTDDGGGTLLSKVLNDTVLRSSGYFVSPEQRELIRAANTEIVSDNSGSSWFNTILVATATVTACLAYPSGPVARIARRQRKYYRVKITVVLIIGYITLACAGTIAQIILIIRGKEGSTQTEHNSVTTPDLRGYEYYAAYDRVVVSVTVFDNDWTYKIFLIALSSVMGGIAVVLRAVKSHKKYTLTSTQTQTQTQMVTLPMPTAATQPPPQTGKGAGCIADYQSVIATHNRTKAIRDLKPGDAVATDEGFQEYIGNMHDGSVLPTIVLHTKSSSVEITMNHLVKTKSGFLHASDIAVGDFLVTSSYLEAEAGKVVRITYATSFVSCPLTRSGTIIVNDVVLSCYASVNSHMVAKISTYPLRMGFFKNVTLYIDSLIYIQNLLPRFIRRLITSDLNF